MTPIETVRAFMAHMAVKDYDAALKLVTDDCEYFNSPLPTVRGPQGIRSVLEPFFAPTIENEFVVVREASAGPIVFQERLDRHRLPDRWVELPVNGVFEVRDGRIAVWRDYFDMGVLTTAWPELLAA